MTRAANWWTPALSQATMAFADHALPNEVCGLIFTADNDVGVHCFRAVATPIRCRAQEQDVIDFALSLEQQKGSVLATFHSHPIGSAQWSASDMVLSDWANVHLLLTRVDDTWALHWFTTGNS